MNKLECFILLKSSQMIVGNSGAYPSIYAITFKYRARLPRLARDKPSSLLVWGVSNEEKSFTTLTYYANVIKLFFFDPELIR